MEWAPPGRKAEIQEGVASPGIRLFPSGTVPCFLPENMLQYDNSQIFITASVDFDRLCEVTKDLQFGSVDC
jgi:hypothetical protein